MDIDNKIEQLRTEHSYLVDSLLFSDRVSEYADVSNQIFNFNNGDLKNIDKFLNKINRYFAASYSVFDLLDKVYRLNDTFVLSTVKSNIISKYENEVSDLEILKDIYIDVVVNIHDTFVEAIEKFFIINNIPVFMDEENICGIYNIKSSYINDIVIIFLESNALYKEMSQQ